MKTDIIFRTLPGNYLEVEASDSPTCICFSERTLHRLINYLLIVREIKPHAKSDYQKLLKKLINISYDYLYNDLHAMTDFEQTIITMGQLMTPKLNLHAFMKEF